ncbi:MAG TPA: bifunctional hydroxymethylpyrimidine kinase/phosphomethylpyrimidine kinase [Blastocatellia bacterium]
MNQIVLGPSEKKSSGKTPVVLAIGGLDPSAGAGILADIKTISAFGCYGVAAVTSITVQNTTGVSSIHNQPAELVYDQIKALLDDFQIRAIKTGMLPNAGIIEAVASVLGGKSDRTLVVDPVLQSTSGFDLASDIAALVERIFPMASLVTPNAKEAGRITGIDVVDEGSMEEAGRVILKLGAGAVLVKGGDMNLAESIDILIGPEGPTRFAAPKIGSNNTHGTGCTLASAIAALLATGTPLSDAMRRAKAYVSKAIGTAPEIGNGFGPLNHFPKEDPED